MVKILFSSVVNRTSILRGHMTWPCSISIQFIYIYSKIFNNNSYLQILLQTLLIKCMDVELNPGPLQNVEIVHLNVRSIRNKIDVIEAQLHDSDIICITESHLNPLIPNSDIKLESFSDEIHRKDRTTGHGGGVIIYHKNNILTKRRHDLENEHIEMIWIEVLIQNHKFLLGCIYRPDSNIEYWSKFEQILDKASETSMDILITGDLNVDMLRTPPTSHLSRLLTKFNLKSIINKPTRVTPDSATSIDVVFTNNPSIVKNTHVDPAFCSDHSPIYMEVCYAIFKHKAYKKTVWMYNNTDYNIMNDELNVIDWNLIAADMDTQELDYHRSKERYITPNSI
ncbi:uncharacterized protein LOC110465005 [Mizuhopecten yessoensis]|uniref:uncharacterized protein LOC110449239 n=1 Tax=Mizuhopecten yessoensis TaxID=6573 RepID=UPI000B457433|nr:uncharacterized protein LOC110449239 [Mizuhopecten yessoensis]XP_021359090.1 uncharacterized protein LOC110454073 [Mizuhopecten yessoensis]XP_021364029.1 uncharacterized protein LOC110457192 [Mizuhopecten yessoensis]XP_021364312.1 uncharacterized protein LOC110457386 [Mizuhopecten yessoensis]XP_021366062.1 uncharacterized protein LOC110458609 [Mizuhopecten yessoensis]XP_021376223.1 uncharacterized protein LOC110465005 [Mizuhopecten yessoensis]